MESQKLADQIRQWMVARRQTLAVAESVTCGNVQSILGSVSGASEYFAGGVTTYRIDQKVWLLDVDRDHAADVNCVSERVAREMACGTCRIFRSNWSVATTGYAEPNSEQNVQIPFAHVCVWHVDPVCEHEAHAKIARQIECPVEDPMRDRVTNQRYLARMAVEALWEAVCGGDDKVNGSNT